MSVDRGRCPRCASQGKDRAGNNLAIYNDGHTYCYSCGFYTPSPMNVRVAALQKNEATEITRSDVFNFPTDYVTDLPQEALHWLKGFGIRDDEIEDQRFGWSPKMKFLIFPVFDNDGNLLMWQGRNFNPYPLDKPKYLTGGPKHDIIHKVGIENKRDNAIIVTEDLLSAIKVGRLHQAAPLWGSTIPLGMVRKLATQYDVLGIWLDPDKKLEAVKQAIRTSQYIPTFVVDSALDPKQYTTVIISEFIEEASKSAIWKDDNSEETWENQTMIREHETYKDFFDRTLHLFPAGHGGFTMNEYINKKKVLDKTR